jgi:tumor protein p53-inducible protein 3
VKAVLVQSPGGREQLYIGEVNTPIPGETEIRIKVQATAVNRADIAQRQGNYPPPKGASPILGLELAGIVDKVGPKVSKWKKGDRVFGLLEGGGYAEYALLSENMAMAIPEDFSFTQAAAIPEVFLTAFQALFWIGKLEAGEMVLIHAGASGVGTAAIQLAKAKGATVVVTAGSDEKCEACKELGADFAINYKTTNFVEAVAAQYGDSKINLILDFIGAPYWEGNLKALALDGRLVIISTMGGAKLDQTSLGYLMMKRLTVSGTTLRSRTLEYKEALTQDFSSWALEIFEKGELKPVVDSVFAIEDVQEAHRYMEENRNIGKIVLTF